MLKSKNPIFSYEDVSDGADCGFQEGFALVRRLDAPIWIYDIDRYRILAANRSACALWQANTEADLCARDMSADMSPTVSARLKQYQADFQRDVCFNEMWTLYPNGKPESVMVLFRGFKLPDKRMAMLCEVVNRTDDEPENLRSTEALLHTDVMISLFTESGPSLYMNPAARQASADPGQRLMDIFVEPTDHDHLRFQLEQSGASNMVARVKTAYGDRWHDISAKTCLDAATGQPAILVTSNDVTALKDARDKARHLADRDQLTGCYNRAFLQQRMESLAKRQHKRCAILYFDVDRFKQINDRFGHEMGDVVLKKLVSRAQRSIRASDLIARLGGDEFVILFEEAPSEEIFGPEISRLLETLSKPILHLSNRLNVTVSIGVAFFKPRSAQFTTVLREADIALYASKQAGRNRLTFFNEKLGAAAKERDQIEIELKAAIDRKEFVLHYQPRIDLVTRRIVSAEALVRWQHPTRGMIMPNAFIPICEETGMIEDLGRQILDIGCKQAIAWNRDGCAIDLSLNVSPRQFNDKELMKVLHDYACEPDFPAGRIELEITENVLIGDHDMIAKKLRKITKMGYRIAIDDFGIGYSNLSYISRFPLTCLKIDRSFIRQLPSSGPIIRLILTMARQIGATTVAEGVETQAELDWLIEQDCDQVQGFLLCKPVPLPQLIDAVERFNSGEPVF